MVLSDDQSSSALSGAILIPSSGGLAVLATAGKVIELSVKTKRSDDLLRAATATKVTAGVQRAQSAGTTVVGAALSSPVITNPDLQRNAVDFVTSILEGPP
jgi:hypothetical protein